MSLMIRSHYKASHLPCHHRFCGDNARDVLLTPD
uniref:Uncharacterized protein n=1 Tax=Anguilla anguilla TaxID=7936 RepID=A0A0E9USG8_ANGAN